MKESFVVYAIMPMQPVYGIKYSTVNYVDSFKTESEAVDFIQKSAQNSETDNTIGFMIRMEFIAIKPIHAIY